jgi:hypothetical protein
LGFVVAACGVVVKMGVGPENTTPGAAGVPVLPVPVLVVPVVVPVVLVLPVVVVVVPVVDVVVVGWMSILRFDGGFVLPNRGAGALAPVEALGRMPPGVAVVMTGVT